MSERDLSRAQWQRSEGMVLYSGHADRLYTDPVQHLDDSVLTHIFTDPLPKRIDPNYSVKYYANKVASAIFCEPKYDVDDYEFSDEIVSNNDAYTYRQEFSETLHEANFSMQNFPIDLIFAIVAVADDKGIGGYKLDDLHNLADMLRRDDIRSMIDESAFTANGFWVGDPGNGDYDGDLRRYVGDDNFVFDEDSHTVNYSRSFIRRLRKPLADNNKIGLNGFNRDGTLDSSPSSGCPARNLKPQFGSTEADSVSIEGLAKHFGITEEEVTARREQTAINVGLDYLANAIELAAQFQDTLLVKQN